MLKPWGFYLVFLKGMQFKVKLLYFKKGKSISYQRHSHRKELWLFIFGAGLMRVQDNVYISKIRGEAELIERNQWHQYTAAKRTLVLEVQFGGACMENDIERS